MGVLNIKLIKFIIKKISFYRLINIFYKRAKIFKDF